MSARSSVIVELVGPAGAGKSSVSGSLVKRDPSVRLGLLPDVRDAASMPFFAWNALLLLPSFVRFYRRRTDRFLTPGEMAYLAIIRGWLPRLRKQPGIVILDQGPVYMLSELLRTGPEALVGGPDRRWWEATCERWARGLDKVIYLDAPDPALVERALNREQDHGIKEHDGRWAAEFLARSRRTLDQVLAGLRAFRPDLEIVRMDTSLGPLEETVDGILSILKRP